METKRCTDCGNDLPLAQYYVYRSRNGQLFSRCKDCIYKRTKAWRYGSGASKYKAIVQRQQKSPATRKSRKKRSQDPLVKAKRSTWQKEYRETHREFLSRTGAARRKKYEAAYKAWRVEYLKTERGKANSSRAAHKRRMQITASESLLTADEWGQIKSTYRNLCAYCHRPRKLEQDHVVPLTKGGTHTKGNVVPACRQCNARKGAQTVPFPHPADLMRVYRPL